MNPQQVEIAENLETSLAKAIEACEHDRLFILTDHTTRELCWPVVSGFPCLQGAEVISIGATDTHKTLDSLTHVWEELGRMGGTRHTLLINIGGGMVTDLGGFAASTFKRGINYINIPTTLLAMVDASVGGKTGINFNGLKNEIGVFSEAHTVILSTLFLKTLDRENILSGYAEMLKHSLIADEATWSETLLLADSLPLTDSRCDYLSRQTAGECSDRNNQSEQSVINASQFSALSSQLKKSVEVKERIVTEDPKETGLRKALNLGHTAGHAFESFAMQQGRPVLHGYAVAYGLVCELWLSAVKCGFPTDKLRQTVSLIRENYGQMAITCDDYPALINLMRHDKKNRDGIINFTLLSDIGDIRINQSVTDEDIRQSLDFYREG